MRTPTLALLLACALSAPAAAAPITSLYSTGLGAPGAADPHYALVSAPGGYNTAFVVAGNSKFPFDAYWAANGYTPAPGAPASGWIAPTADVNTTHPDGYYTYRTTFSLSGFNPATAAITGFLAADNAADVYLNGALVAHVYAAGGYTFTPTSFSQQAFSINKGFGAGQNTLDFVVYNEVQATGNPTGLRVAMSGTADKLALIDPIATPEPATLAVFGFGLVGLTGYLRRRRTVG